MRLASDAKAAARLRSAVLTWGQLQPAVLGSKRSEFCYRETAAD